MSIRRFFTSLLLCPLLVFSFWVEQPVAHGQSLDSLNQTKQELDRKIKEAEQEKEAQKSVAERAADKVANLDDQISGLEGQISQTEQSIADTQGGIGQQNQELARLESELRRIKDQQDAMVRQMYILRESAPDSLLYFSDEPVSKREERQAQMSALKKSVAAVYEKTKASKDQVEKTRLALIDKNDQLERMKTQQAEQKRGLANYQYAQMLLKEDAESAIQQLEAETKKWQKEAAKIDDQISQVLASIIQSRSNGTFVGGAGVGKRVHRGDFVGYQGNTGYSFGDHVHFEVRVNGAPVNPLPYINDGTLSWPLTNFQITQYFGRTPYSYLYSGGIHTGVDVAGPVGSPVFAPAEGTVVLNQDFGDGYSYGHAWAMQLDNGIYVLMGHLRR